MHPAADPQSIPTARHARERGRRGVVARPGFTLIESAMAVVVVGLGVLAMVDAQQAFIRANLWSSQAASATFLANEVREYTRNLSRHDRVSGLTIVSGVLSGWGPEAGETSVTDFDDLDDFDGITFAFDGTVGHTDGDLPGPINAFGEVIAELEIDGDTATDANGDLPMRGWSQTVIVEKVDPFNFGTTRGDAYFVGPGSASPPIAVDEFPLRVSVEVRYQTLNDVTGELITTVTWIVPR
jgi:prepilin-type N-terminal cleavage/methylation domain-containing protein